jgi:chemotaxis protein histidine kinase CheA
MKRLTVVTLMLVLLAAFSVAAATQTKMSPQLCTNIGTCADMMQEMAEALKSGKLSPAETQEVISHMSQMARIMKEMSGPTGPSLEQQHAQELEQVKKKWERLREIRRSMMPTKP